MLILDRMLPELDGIGVVALMRAEGVSTPVLFLTNLCGVGDRVEGWRRAATTTSSSRSPSPNCWPGSTRLRAADVGRPDVLRAGDLEMDLVPAPYDAAARTSTCSRANFGCSNT